MTTNEVLINHLGKSSYPAIVSEIHNKLLNSEADTLEGESILKNAFSKLNESTTPILTLKEFTTNAEELAPHDAKLCDIVDFVKKQVKSGDMNFLVNVCKEEHYRELTRAGLPTVDETIKDIEDHFNEPSSIIEELMKKGLFDKLRSNLLMEIKSDLPKSQNKLVDDVQLNESYLGNNTYMYNPVGVRYFDKENERVILLMEHQQFLVNSNTIEPLNESVDIAAAHQRLSAAVYELPYAIEDQTFSLAQDWDFNLSLLNNGKIAMDLDSSEEGVYVEPNDLQDLLFESINKYVTEGKISSDSQKHLFMRDADNFVMLAENHNRLVQVDEVVAIKNTVTNDVVLLNESLMAPYVIATNTTLNTSFETFKEMNESINSTFGVNTNQLFEGLLNLEANLIATKQACITNLFESQNELNSLISDNNGLLNVAEEGSPAFQKLNESNTKLNELLDQNLETLKVLNSTTQLYEDAKSVLGAGAEYAVEKTLGVNKPIRAGIAGFNKVAKALHQTQQEIEQKLQQAQEEAQETQEQQDLDNLNQDFPVAPLVRAAISVASPLVKGAVIAGGSAYLGDIIYNKLKSLDKPRNANPDTVVEEQPDVDNLNESVKQTAKKIVNNQKVKGAAAGAKNTKKKPTKKTNQSQQSVEDLEDVDDLNEGSTVIAAKKYYNENKHGASQNAGKSVGKAVKQVGNKIKSSAGRVVSAPARFGRGVASGLKQQEVVEDMDDFEDDNLNESVLLTTGAIVGAYHGGKYLKNKLK